MAIHLKIRSSAAPSQLDTRITRVPRHPVFRLVRRPDMAAAAAGDAHPAPEAVVQQQLEAYNARDLEKFMALLAEDCIARDAVTGAVMGSSKAELRKRYEGRFQTDVHSELLGRLCLGSVVVDREIISGLPGGAAADCLATYHVEGGLIKRMEFVWQPRKQ